MPHFFTGDINGRFIMVARWLLGFTLALQVTLALASNDPVRDNWNQHLKNQDVYNQRTQRAGAETIANIKMGAPNSAERTSVKQLLVRSGVAIDGSKVKIGASVTKPVDTAKVASTLVDRLKNAKSYAKNLGKASIPAFVGTAAFHALMEGIDWVMDEGGNVTKKPDQESEENLKYTSQYKYLSSGGDFYSYSSFEDAARKKWDEWHASNSYQYQSLISVTATTYYPPDSPYKSFEYKYRGYDADQKTGYTFKRESNPDYKPDHVAESEPVSDADLETALKNALESNNPALATAIAEAMKSAYTQDNSEGQPKTTNPLVADAQNDMQRAVDGALDTPTSTGGTAERPSGYYKITDGDKTIEGYVTPSDTTSTGTTDSTTTPNPDGSSTTTGTTAQTWPGFCDWANVVCEFIDWVKDDEYLKEDEPEEIDDSIFSREFDIEFNMGASCPPNPIWNFDFVGQHWSKEIDITRICNFFKYLGYAIVFASNLTALWIVYGAVTTKE